jgi:phosphopantothenoylcysteine decarboxylase / phosphopantothenate---cysteine ligase
VSSASGAPEVLFQLSGSIAAYKACHVVSRLVQAGCRVQTVATRAALEFVGPATLEGLTGRPVATDTFAPGSHMDHIHLVRRADLIVLCPATANTINRLASGIADDLVGTMFLAYDFRVPYVIVPAMNAAMYEHPATAASLARLRGWGIEFVDPSAGSLACGEIGPGRLAEPDDILAELLRRLELGDTTGDATATGANGKVLITSGGTKVPIDGVRSITNTSTGATGAAIAE